MTGPADGLPDIPGLVEPPPPESSPGPFAGRSAGDVVRVVLREGGEVEGELLLIGGMRFVSVAGGPLGTGRCEGPFRGDDVASLTVLRTRAEVQDDRRTRRMGEPVPGTVRRTRDGYEARLELLARLAAATADPRRRDQVECQFESLADEIALARTKRAWMLAVARWARHSNREPEKIDLSGGDMSMADRFQRPRPQDFDPDPVVRRRRPVRPPHVASDSRSTHNMRAALRAAGFRVRVSVLGEATDDVADLLVDFPGGKEEGRFMVVGRRGPDGMMAWRHSWDGNGSRADGIRHRRALARPAYAALVRTVREGLRAGKAAPAEPAAEAAAPPSP